MAKLKAVYTLEAKTSGDITLVEGDRVIIEIEYLDSGQRIVSIITDRDSAQFVIRAKTTDWEPEQLASVPDGRQG